MSSSFLLSEGSVEFQTHKDKLRCPGVMDYLVHAAAKFVRARIVAARIEAAHNKTRLKARLPLTPSWPARTVLDFWDDENAKCDSGSDEDDTSPDFRVLVEFLEEIQGWSGSVFKVRVSEFTDAGGGGEGVKEKEEADFFSGFNTEKHSRCTEFYAVKIRLSEELPDADASNSRAFATMSLLQEFGRTRDLCPSPIHYMRQVPLPAMTKNEIKRHCSQPGLRRPLPPLSALICTWITGEKVPMPLPFTPTSWEKWWKPLVQLRASVARVKKPFVLSAPTLSPCYRAVRNICDHDVWLKNLDTRIAGLSYIYSGKKQQDLVPRWLEEYLGATVPETGLPRIQHLGRRLDLCLSKLQALSRDGEAAQDLRLCVADPSLDNVLKLDEHNERLCFLDLENSGWAQPSYIVAEMLVHNVWLDKPGVEDGAFPFDDGFVDFVAVTFALMIRMKEDDMALYRERMELHKEFCVLRGLLFHIRGALQEVGHKIDGSRTVALSPGNGSGSGAGSARLGGNSGKWSPTRVGGMTRANTSGRTSINAYGFPHHFRATHRRGFEVFVSMLEGANYTQRTLDHMIDVHSYLDTLVEAEGRGNES